MGAYSRIVFPHLCEMLLDRPPIARRRHALLTAAAGEVLEIGFGTGLNLPHYPDRVRRITTVEPSPGMNRLAQRRIAQSPIQVVQHALSGERLPFDDGSFDCVVSTFTLCSIDDVVQAVAEAYRVLRPAGKLLFLEHGLSPEPGVQAWQRRLNWLEMLLADGCRLDRDVRGLVAGLPFAGIVLEEEYLPHLPKTHGYFYRGVAVK